MSLCTIAACLPTLKPLFKNIPAEYLFSSLRTLFSNKSDNTSHLELRQFSSTNRPLDANSQGSLKSLVWSMTCENGNGWAYHGFGSRFWAFKVSSKVSFLVASNFTDEQSFTIIRKELWSSLIRLCSCEFLDESQISSYLKLPYMLLCTAA